MRQFVSLDEITGLPLQAGLCFKITPFLNNQNKSNKGGARPGAGRKKVHDEIAARDLAVSAIVSKFGSLEKGMVELLNSEEPSLVKFVYEHAFGKPADKIQHGGEVGIKQITGMIVK